MTHRVTARCPSFPNASRILSGQALDNGTLGAFAQLLAHAAGAQLTQVALIPFGPDEITTGSIRVGHFVSQNCKNVVASMVPWGYTGGGTSGTVEYVGAAGVDTKVVHFPAAGTTLDQLSQRMLWVKDVSASAETFVTHEFVLTDVLPHSLSIWEAPLGLLDGSDAHVDRSFGSSSRVTTDDPARGWPALLNGILRARRNMRRHLVNIAYPTTTSTGGRYYTGGTTIGYVIGSATSDDGIRVRPRMGVGGLDLGEAPARFRIYIADPGSSTWTVFVDIGGHSGNFTGVNAAGWWPTNGLAVRMDALDYLKVRVQRTAGSGHLRIGSYFLGDDMPLPT